MQFCVLGSGSKGNATYIQAGETAILIDAGFSGVEIKRRLAAVGVDFSSLDAILVTHEHNDHIRGVPVLSRQGGIPVFANKATYLAAGAQLEKLASFREFDTGVSFVFQDLTIHPFSISHDTADPVGFIISDGIFSLGYCTDTGVVSRLMAHRLADCHGLILETNHDPEMLKKSAYPPYLKQRIRGKQGHLANRDAALFLKHLLHDGLEQVVLAHISESNNHPDVAFREVMAVIGGNGNGSGGDVHSAPCVSVAAQNRPGRMIRLGNRKN